MINIKYLIKLFLIFTFGLRVHAMAFEVDAKGICHIDGVEFPGLGFGTYPSQGETCFKAVSAAAAVGYRILDTATFYNNFEPIGEAIKPFGRKNFYIISKVWPDAHTPELLQKDLQTTLAKLQTNYLDAYLLHWPNSKVSIETTLKTLETLKNQGLIRHIGLSNVTVNHLRRALELNIPISWVQVEMNPQFYDSELLKFCHKNSITVQAWAPFGRGRLVEDPLLIKLGKKYGKSPAQIALKWILQHKCVPLPGSKNELHMKENWEINDFTLSKKDMNEIDQRAKKGQRERVTAETGLGFTDEFDYIYEECWPKAT